MSSHEQLQQPSETLGLTEQKMLYFVNLIEGEWSASALARAEEEILHDFKWCLPKEELDGLEEHFRHRQKKDVRQSIALVSDPLTLLADRRFLWMYYLPGLRKLGHQACFGWYADLCNLKDFNRPDIWGHQGGDAAIAAVALILRGVGQVSQSLPLRLYGEEFLLISERPFPDPDQVAQALKSGLQKITPGALIGGTIESIPILDYSTWPPSQIQLTQSGYEELRKIAQGELADILFPVKATYAPFSLDLTMPNEQITLILVEAERECEARKTRLRRDWESEFPLGVMHLARKGG